MNTEIMYGDGTSDYKSDVTQYELACILQDNRCVKVHLEHVTDHYIDGLAVTTLDFNTFLQSMLNRWNSKR